MSDLGDRYGRGLGFAVEIGPSGSFLWSEGPTNVRESIRLILMTDPGERLMRPAFGVGLRRFLFEPNVPATHRLLEESVRTGLRRWEPRIRVTRVEVAAHDAAEASVTVSYELVATGEAEQFRLAVPVAGGS